MGHSGVVDMGLQTRCDATGMETVAVQILLAVTAVEFVGEVDVCGLGLGIGEPGVVEAGSVETVIVDVDAAVAVTRRTHRDDAGGEFRGGGGEEERLQELEEQEVGEVVGAELGFMAVGCFRVGGDGHDAGVVDEDVEGRGAGFEGFGCFADL